MFLWKTLSSLIGPLTDLIIFGAMIAYLVRCRTMDAALLVAGSFMFLGVRLLYSLTEYFPLLAGSVEIFYDFGDILYIVGSILFCIGIVILVRKTIAMR